MRLSNNSATVLHRGICWAVLIYLLSAANDVVTRFLGDRLHWAEIAFFRFFFSTILVSMAMICSRERGILNSKMHQQHAVRGALGAIALGLCCFSVNSMPLAENTTILFSEALFMLPLSAICLKETITRRSIMATLLGFAGLLVIYRPGPSTLRLMAIVPTMAALLFAYMNIMIKRMVTQGEKNKTMLFYFGIYSTAAAAVALPFVWTPPTWRELCLLTLLGIGANAIQICIFYAYRATEASRLSPIRYIELPFAMLFGFLFFGQEPGLVTLAGATLIIIGGLLAARGAPPVLRTRQTTNGSK
jgi:S-adenosylmethionine uptake transporter